MAVLGTRCYESCPAAYNMEDCGWFACAADKAACGGTILEMGFDVLAGAAQGASLIASFGTSASATPALAGAKGSLKAGVKKVGTKTLSAGLKATIKALKKAKTAIIKKAAKLIRRETADKLIDWASL